MLIKKQRRFCSPVCQGATIRGLARGDRHSESKTKYIRVWAMRSDGQKRRVYLHRLIVEKDIGRELTDSEVVHHLDENPRNNRRENLRLFASQSEHLQFHIDNPRPATVADNAENDFSFWIAADTNRRRFGNTNTNGTKENYVN